MALSDDVLIWPNGEPLASMDGADGLILSGKIEHLFLESILLWSPGEGTGSSLMPCDLADLR